MQQRIQMLRVVIITLTVVIGSIIYCLYKDKKKKQNESRDIPQ